ncbi:MAG: hypothetical protein LBQ87_08875 [Candidatus Fibromonas sp.]|jgi:hypothetical protein|nr:hypothetical protein [Candidatus Fibromonas sp.]
MTKVLTEEEMERLGSYFDEHGEEEWEEAERNGDVFSVSELGCNNAAAATARLAEMYKEKAKAHRKPYRRFLNKVLAQASVK